jgi:transcription elongation factor Elf1
MNLLRRLACLVFGHAPTVERRGDDSILVCGRCGHHFEVFVKGVYAGREPEAATLRKGPA